MTHTHTQAKQIVADKPQAMRTMPQLLSTAAPLPPHIPKSALADSPATKSASTAVRLRPTAAFELRLLVPFALGFWASARTAWVYMLEHT